jgi:carboxymethylenebutenolidase
MFSTRTIAAIAVILAAACHRSVMVEDHSAHMAASPTSGVAMQGSTALPASNNAAAARLAASPRRGEWIKVPFEAGSKDTITAWVVYPSAARGKAPVVVIVHDITGLSTWARTVADQAAAEGFVAVTPDFTSRPRGAPSTVELPRDSAGKLMAMVNAAERNRIISTVATRVMSFPQAEHRYAVIGYCWGGGTTFMHVVNGGVSGFAGGVAYYGLPYMNGASPIRDSLAKIKVPVMLFNGSKDARIGAAMPAVDSAMKSLGKNYVGTNYEGAVHGFMRSQDDPKATRDLVEEAANLAATKDAWPRTVQFLKQNLGVR